jgi:DNA (cytosine-5)-methyltransferase 1
LSYQTLTNGKKELTNATSNYASLYKAIDLFAGIGGIRVGFKNAFKEKVEFVFSSEIDKHAKETYKLNYNEEPYGDITRIDEKDIPKHNIILAGFPCQAFSVAGYRKGFEDTRGTLFFDVVRIASYHKPEVLFLENVKGFANHDKGKTFDIVKKTLEDIGYRVYHKVLNTKDFGIPQNRERIYIVALKKSIKKEFKFPEVNIKPAHITSYLDKNVDKIYYYNNKPLYDRLKDEVVSKDTVYQWRRQYVRANKNGVCPTLTANMGTGGHNVPIIKDDNGIRKLTPMECARLQGFDNNFKFPDNLALSHRYKQIGNSVTVKVIEEIAKEILNVLQ